MQTGKIVSRNLRLLRVVAFILCGAALLAGLTPAFAQGALSPVQPGRVVRVFYPLQEGFAQRDEEGVYSGYTYDFLMDIAQLTGWRYEFEVVDATNENLMAGLEAVKNGELDLACAMTRHPSLEKDYLYSSLSYGSTRYTLVSLESNRTLNLRTIFDKKNLKIALSEGATAQNQQLNTYCEQNGLQYEPVYAESLSACKALVESGQADAMISKEAAFLSGYKTLVEFSSQSFYFATNHQNSELMDELDRALTSVLSAAPEIQEQRFRTYFTKPSDYVLSLTADELVYLENAPVLRVAFFMNRAPIQDYDPKTGVFSGVMVDILNLLSQKSGLRFELTPVKNRAEAQQLVLAGDVDLVAGIPHSYASPEKLRESGVLLTSPVLNLPVVRASSLRPSANSQILLVYADTKLFLHEENVQYEEDIQKILRLLESGAYAEAYLCGHISQHYLEQDDYQNVTLSLSPYGSYPLCLGVARGEDLRLVSILEQTISTLTPTEVENILYQNTAHARQVGILDVIKRNPLPFMLGSFVILILVATLLLAFLLKTRRINRLISKERSRYQELSQADGMTHLLNSVSFRTLVDDYLSGPDAQAGGTLLVMDIDHFKQVNDTFGHLTGDETLVSLAELLQAVFYDKSLIGRVGGDEFAVLLKGVSDHKQVKTLCQGLLLDFKDLNEQRKTTLSIGGASFCRGATYQSLFHQADAALYKVKQQGRNGFVLLHDPENTCIEE